MLLTQSGHSLFKKEHVTMTLQEIFNTVVMDDEQLTINLPDKRAYDNLRVALVRKFSGYRQQCQAVGIPSYDDKYLSCSFAATGEPGTGTSTGTFQLKWREDSKRVRKEYAALKL
jgi:hypothetical protein